MAQMVLRCGVDANVIFLLALGFQLVLRTSRALHFAHGLAPAIGAYSAWCVVSQLGGPLSLGCLCGMFAAGLFGIFVESTVYGPLRRCGGTARTLLVASIGVYVVGQNALSIAFGDHAMVMRSSLIAPLNLLGAGATTPQVIILVGGLLIGGVTHGALTRAAFGLRVRSLANDCELAGLYGVPTERIVLVTMSFASVIAGFIGVLMACDGDLSPAMGLNPLLCAMVAALLAESGRIMALAASSTAISCAQKAMGWYLGARWQDTAVFVMLIVCCGLSTTGWLGQKMCRRRSL